MSLTFLSREALLYTYSEGVPKILNNALYN